MIWENFRLYYVLDVAEWMEVHMFWIENQEQYGDRQFTVPFWSNWQFAVLKVCVKINASSEFWPIR